MLFELRCILCRRFAFKTERLIDPIHVTVGPFETLADAREAADAIEVGQLTLDGQTLRPHKLRLYEEIDSD